MLAVAFDTLKLARNFESAGFQPKQAQDASAAIAIAFSEWQANINLATREDVQKQEISIQKLDAATQQRFAELKAEIQTTAERTKAEILKWMFGQTFVIIAAIIGFLRVGAH